MLRMQIVIEKDRVVRAGTQELLRFGDVVGDVEIVALEATGKPAMATHVVIQQEDSDRVAFSADVGKPELSEYRLQQFHSSSEQLIVKLSPCCCLEGIIRYHHTLSSQPQFH